VAKIKHFGVTIDELRNVIDIIDTTIKGKWNKTVPIIPGDPKQLRHPDAGWIGEYSDA